MLATTAPNTSSASETSVKQPLNGYVVAILALCIFVGMAEGYDAQAMGFAAPLLRLAWGLGYEQIGLLMSTSAMGLVAGSFLLSPLGDRYGRRPAILAGLLVAGAGTGAGALAPDMFWMIVTRVIAGVGLALAIPNGLAIALEMAPVRMRSFAVVLVLCGYPLGAGVGSAIVSFLVPHLGWTSAFVVGAGMSGVALVCCYFFLPESPSFLAHRPARADELRRITGKLGYSTAHQDGAAEIGASGGTMRRVKALFTTDRRTATLLFWLMNLGNVALVYFYVGWLPTLFVGSDIDPQTAIKAMALFSATGAFGAIAMVLLLQKAGPIRMLCLAYTVSALATAMLAYYDSVDVFLYVALSVAGVFVTGSSFCLSAIVANYYPSDVRATASGFATGIGRAGAVLTPLAVGVLIGRSEATRKSFAIAIVPAVIALVAALVFELLARDRGSRYSPAP